MSASDETRAVAIRQAVERYIQQRLAAALETVKGTDTAAEKRRADLRETYRFPTLIHEGVKYCTQVQLATHLVKAVNPDPPVKSTTNPLIKPGTLPPLAEVGTHALGANFEMDATGNGAVNKKVAELAGVLTQVCFEGQPLLEAAKAGDADVLHALALDGEEWGAKVADLAQLDAPRCPAPASHRKLKQLYWLVGADPHDASSYHLLAPLYPSSLVHRVFQTLQEERFHPEAQAAREARKAQQPHPRPVREYSNLAVQKLGGTKPQNISQLNSERRGENTLFASVPPVWRVSAVRPVMGAESLFKVYGRRRWVQQQAQALKTFLLNEPVPNRHTRARRNAYIQTLLDELMQFTAEQHTLAPGWSLEPTCRLFKAHRLWLDPQADRPDEPPPDLDSVAEAIAEDFARWLNTQLEARLPVGDDEFAHWRALALEQLSLNPVEIAHVQP